MTVEHMVWYLGVEFWRGSILLWFTHQISNYWSRSDSPMFKYPPGPNTGGVAVFILGYCNSGTLDYVLQSFQSTVLQHPTMVGGH